MGKFRPLFPSLGTPRRQGGSQFPRQLGPGSWPRLAVLEAPNARVHLPPVLSLQEPLLNFDLLTWFFLSPKSLARQDASFHHLGTKSFLVACGPSSGPHRLECKESRDANRQTNWVRDFALYAARPGSRPIAAGRGEIGLEQLETNRRGSNHQSHSQRRNIVSGRFSIRHRGCAGAARRG